MMNYIAYYLLRIVLRQIPGTTARRTPDFPETATLSVDWLRELTNNSRLNQGLLWVVIAVVVYYIILEKTSFGLSLKLTGHNSDAARYSGANIQRNLVLSMSLAGAFAGLAGIIVALGSIDYGRLLEAMDNYGFTGITVALVSQGATMPTVYAGLLFGALQSSAPSMSTQGIPPEIVQIMIGLIVIFAGIEKTVRRGMTLRISKLRRQIAESPAPASSPDSGTAAT